MNPRVQEELCQTTIRLEVSFKGLSVRYPILNCKIGDVHPSFLNVCCFYEDAVNKQSAGQVNSLMDPGALGLTQAQIEQIDIASCKSN